MACHKENNDYYDENEDTSYNDDYDDDYDDDDEEGDSYNDDSYNDEYEYESYKKSCIKGCIFHKYYEDGDQFHKYYEEGDQPHKYSRPIVDTGNTTDDPTFFDIEKPKESFRSLTDIDINTTDICSIKNKNDAIEYINKNLLENNRSIMCYNIEKNFIKLISKWNSKLNKCINYKISSKKYGIYCYFDEKTLNRPVNVTVSSLSELSIEKLHPDIGKFISESLHTLAGSYDSLHEFEKKNHRFNCKLQKIYYSYHECYGDSLQYYMTDADIICYKLLWTEDNCEININFPQPLAYITYIEPIEKFDPQNAPEDLLKDITCFINKYKHICHDLEITLLNFKIF